MPCKYSMNPSDSFFLLNLSHFSLHPLSRSSRGFVEGRECERENPILLETEGKVRLEKNELKVVT